MSLLANARDSDTQGDQVMSKEARALLLEKPPLTSLRLQLKEGPLGIGTPASPSRETGLRKHNESHSAKPTTQSPSTWAESSPESLTPPKT